MCHTEIHVALKYTAPRRYCRQAVHKLITSFHSKCYRPAGMLIHRQNSYAPRGKKRTGGRGAQIR
jgi:hypothetical protein